LHQPSPNTRGNGFDADHNEEDEDFEPLMHRKLFVQWKIVGSLFATFYMT
jgi:hypothetical protein